MVEKAASRYLQRVVERKPRSVYSTHSNRRMYQVLMIEKLECGHELIIHWQGDSCTAKYRTCPQCAKQPEPQKKVVRSEPFIPHWRRNLQEVS
jgi:hypothetical protein